jgi:hypothetical protein
VSAPRNSRSSAYGQRTYTWRQEGFWSVTTIISGGVPKPALLPWGIKSVAEGACDLADELPGLVAKDRDAAVRMLKGIPWASRDKAADIGTLVHAAIEADRLGQPWPPVPEVAQARMDAFARFVADHQPEYQATEASVYSRRWHYAGTLDAIVKLDGRTLLLDAKTGKGVYPEVALQLAAYRYAEFIGSPDGDEEPMVPVDGCAVLHLPPEGDSYELIDVRADEQVFQSFLYALEVFRWQEEHSKTVLLGPLKVGGSEPERAFREAVTG